MTSAPVIRAASGGLTRHLVQTLVIIIVLAAATAAALLGLSLLTNANEAFTNGFAAHHGADVALTVDTSRVTGAQLAATRNVTGVTQVAGPYPQLTITCRQTDGPRPPGAPGGKPAGGKPGHAAGGAGESQITVLGRTSRGGPLDDLVMNQGHWLAGPGQLVMAVYLGGGTIGSKVTVVSAPGKPKLTIVGVGGSVARLGDEDGWVTSGEIAALTPPGTHPMAQMLYTFTKAGTALQVAADVSALKAALPAGAVTSYDSWLGAEGQTSGEQSVNTPFVLAFALIGLVLAVLIVATLVSGAVVAGYRRIGVLKSIGFTPGQVAASYLAQIGLPTMLGVAAGTVAGNLWAGPMLNVAAGLFRVGAQHVPLWIDVAVPVGMCALVALAALVPALRAGRLSAVEAIAAGQAPRSGHGYGAHRLAGRLALPRPVTIGLATPFTRPARTATALAAILFGATAVILAVGLDSSLITLNAPPGLDGGKVVAGTGKGSAQATLTAAQGRRIVTVIRAQPGTLHYAAEADDGPVINSVSLPGGMPGLNLVAYNSDSSWLGLGYPLISGHWYHGPGEVVVNTGFLTEIGLRVGDRFALTVRGRPVPVRIVGQVYFPNGPSLFTNWQTLGGTAAGVRATNYIIGLRPGISPRAYRAALRKALGPGFGAGIPSAGGGPGGADSSISLVHLLTELIAVLAGLGVLTSVLMLTRERVHDLGIFKAVGMTPRQALTMVICWVIAPAVAAAAVAIPAAIYLHALTVQSIGAITGTGVPRTAITVYRPTELLVLAASGLAIAAAGALLPASWAAASRTATALHAE
ncbi:MAG TPA: FtsX-like permease family protein [Streptosporangiaceae bacterium]|nr:FtsX-like permease family protein [Streptosporangiaceae bacterium]